MASTGRNFHASLGNERARKASRPGRRGSAGSADLPHSLTHCEWALALLAVAAPHLLAGIFAWSSALFAGWACLVLSFALWATRQQKAPQFELLSWLFALMLGVTLLHAVPLPPWLSEWLAPLARQHASDTAHALGEEPPRWVGFSLDPGGTWERLLFGAAVLATFEAARVITVTQRSTRLLMAVALSGVGVAVSDLGHRLADARSVYSIYVPSHANARGPLLNPNNLAGYMALALPVCIGLALHRRSGERWAWLIAAATIGATGLLASSRAGAIALLLGPALFAFAQWRRRRRSDKDSESHVSHRAVGIADVGISVLFVAGFGYGFAKLAADGFLDTAYHDMSKLEFLRAEAAAIVADGRTALLGVGRGAFRVAFSAFLDKPVRATHAECLPLQFAMEFGIPLAAVLVLGTVWQVAQALWRWQSSAQLGGLVGIIAIGLQNLIDYSLELSGIAVPAAVCLAAALPRKRSRSDGMRGKVQGWPVAVACAAVTVLSAAPAVRADIVRNERRLQALMARGDRLTFWRLFEDAVRSHPAEPALPALAAADKVTAGDPTAAVWLNRTIILAPGWASPHFWAAQWLAQRGNWPQADEELRAAGELDAEQLLKNLCPWLRGRPASAAALRIAPERGPERLAVLDAAARCLVDESRYADSSIVDRELLRAAPAHVAAQLREARREVAAGNYRDAIARAQAVRRKSMHEVDAYLVEAMALDRMGDAKGAVKLLTTIASQVDDTPQLLEALARAQTRAGQAEAMRETIERMRELAAGDAKRLPPVMALLAECELSLGNDARALKATLEAHRLSNHPFYLASAARLGTKLGQLDFALRAWTELCELAPNEVEYCTNRDRLRQDYRSGSAP